MENQNLGNIGSFELIEKVATGGMASVYLARRAGARGFVKPVAVKVIHPHLAEDPEFAEMFVDEANICSRLSHPNLVPVEELGEYGGFLYLVMEFVDGCSLRALLRRARKTKQRLPLSLVAHIGAQVAEGLHYAHELRGDQEEPLHLVHRDVSPTNLLVNKSGHVKVIDFGVAKSNEQLHQTTNLKVKGKVAYMSPEQIRSKDVDRRSDIYSLAVVLWEMLANRRAFRGKDEVQLVHEVSTKKLPPIETVVEGLPEGLIATLHDATRRPPRERTPTAEVFRQQLLDAVPEAVHVRDDDLAELVRDAAPETPEEGSVHRRVKTHESRSSSSSWEVVSGGTPSSWVGSPGLDGLPKRPVSKVRVEVSTPARRTLAPRDLTSDLAIAPLAADEEFFGESSAHAKTIAEEPADPSSRAELEASLIDAAGVPDFAVQAVEFHDVSGVATPVRSRAPGRRGAWGAALVALLLAGVALGVGWWQLRSSQPKEVRVPGPANAQPEIVEPSAPATAKVERTPTAIDREVVTEKAPVPAAEVEVPPAPARPDRVEAPPSRRPRRARARRPRKRAARAPPPEETVETVEASQPETPPEAGVEVDGVRLATPDALDLSTVRKMKPRKPTVVEQDDVKLADEYQ